MGRGGVYTSLRARVGGLARSASSDMAAFSKSGADGLTRRFLEQVDPDGVLDPAERERRAEAARRMHFAKLALASAKARRKRGNDG